MTGDVTILKLVSNGAGMARLESGELVFVPGALPGEMWRLEELTRAKGVRTTTRATRLSDGKERRLPECPHYRHCGGCSLLHARRDREAALKATYLADNLRRIAGLPDLALEVIPFPDTNSRARGKFHIEEGAVGFRHADGRSVVSVPNCLVIPRSVTTTLDELTRLAHQIAFTGEVFFASDGHDPVFTFRGKMDRTRLDDLETDLQGLAFEDREKRPLRTTGDPTVRFDWNGYPVRLEPTMFFQSNPASWPVFWDHVDRFVATFSPKRVWDVHAGAGFLSTRIKEAELVATEPEPRAFAVLRDFLASERVRTWCGQAETALSKRKLDIDACDAWMLDPPREGLSKTVRGWLRERGPRGLLYFSCDIGSFCRDLAALKQAYEIEGPVTAMNVNPGTLRLEMAVILRRR